MRLTTNELELITESLACFEHEAEQALEMDYNNGPVCQWARDTIEMCDNLYRKIRIVIKTIKNLEERSCDADIVLTPRIKPAEYEATFSNPSEEA